MNGRVDIKEIVDLMKTLLQNQTESKVVTGISNEKRMNMINEYKSLVKEREEWVSQNPEAATNEAGLEHLISKYVLVDDKEFVKRNIENYRYDEIYPEKSGRIETLRSSMPYEVLFPKSV